jgi:hypothetical protein
MAYDDFARLERPVVADFGTLRGATIDQQANT